MFRPDKVGQFVRGGKFEGVLLWKRSKASLHLHHGYGEAGPGDPTKGPAPWDSKAGRKSQRAALESEVVRTPHPTSPTVLNCLWDKDGPVRGQS